MRLRDYRGRGGGQAAWLWLSFYQRIDSASRAALNRPAGSIKRWTSRAEARYRSTAAASSSRASWIGEDVDRRPPNCVAGKVPIGVAAQSQKRFTACSEVQRVAIRGINVSGPEGNGPESNFDGNSSAARTQSGMRSGTAARSRDVVALRGRVQQSLDYLFIDKQVGARSATPWL